MALAVAIVICTRERANRLADLLDTLAQLEVPAEIECTVCFVVNAPKDGTTDDLSSARLPNANVRVLNVPTPGKSRCLNHAISQIAANIYLFTDDDTHPPVDWIRCMIEPIMAGQADCVAGGMRVAPEYDKFCAERYMCMSLSDTRFARQSDSIFLVGGNMAISGSVFAKVPGFDQRLGPGALGFSEDSLFGMQVIAAGCRIVDRLDIVCEHRFDPMRVTSPSLRKRTYREGLCRGYIDYHWHRVFVSQPKLQLANAVEYLRRWRRDNPEIYAQEIGISQDEFSILIGIGQLRQYCRERKKPRAYAFKKSGAASKAQEPGYH